MDSLQGGALSHRVSFEVSSGLCSEAVRQAVVGGVIFKPGLLSHRVSFKLPSDASTGGGSQHYFL